MIVCSYSDCGVSLGRDPVGRQPILLNLCIATPTSFSLCNALSPPPFLPCFILHFLSLSLTPFLTSLLACSIDRDYFCRRVIGFSATLTPFFRFSVNTELLRVCRSVDDSTLGFMVVNLCHDELATPLTADLCTSSRF